MDAEKLIKELRWMADFLGDTAPGDLPRELAFTANRMACLASDIETDTEPTFAHEDRASRRAGGNGLRA